jgi:outer membrane protein TolC
MKSVCWSLLLLVAAASPGHAQEQRKMTLKDCLTAALENALPIREVRHDPPIAKTEIREAEADFDHLLSFRTSGGLSNTPVGSALAGADELREQTFNFESNFEKRLRSGGRYSVSLRTRDLLTNNSFFTVRPQWTSALFLTVQHPLLRFAGTDYNASRIRIAESGYRSSGETYRGVVIATLAAVERAYWNLVFVRENLAVKRHSLRLAEELLRISQRRQEAGAGTRIEVVQAEAGVAEREKEVILAENRVRNAEDLLRSFVLPFADLPETEVRIVPQDEVEGAAPRMSGGLPARLRRAFEARPDVLALTESLAAAGIRVLQAENELLPRLDVYGTVGLQGLDDHIGGSLGDVGRADFTAWEVGISLEIPIGNQAAEARHRRALLTRSRLTTTFESLRNRVMVEVRSAVRNVETAQREITAAKRATAAAMAQFDAEKDRLEADKSTNWQLLQVEQDLSSARSQELLALVGYRVTLVDLEEATGTYLESRGFSAPSPDAGSED